MQPLQTRGRYPPDTPDGQALLDLQDTIERWLDAIDMCESIVEDYERAMQQVLLGDLFELHVDRGEFKTTKRRRIRRLTLENSDDLIERIEDDALSDMLRGFWMERREAEKAARQSLSTA